MQFFCKVHRIGPRNMCVNFERNRLRIEDFEKKWKQFVCFLWRHVAPKRDVVCQIQSTPGRSSHSIMERFPTNQKSLRLPVQKLWPIVCDFYKSGDLDLDLNPNFKRFKTVTAYYGPAVQQLPQDFRDDRPSTVWPVHPSNRRTDKQTNKWKPLRERDYFSKLQVQTWRWWRNEQSLLSDSIIDLDYNISRSKVKDTVNLVLMHQMKSVQWVEYYIW